MKVRVPYSKTKRYLSGMDWIIGTLDHMSHRTTGGSNASQIVLELSGTFDDRRFRAAFTEFVRLFPVLAGRLARDWNLAPYWKMPGRGRPVPLRVETQTVTEPDLLAAIETSVNSPFARRDEHLVLRLFHVSETTHYLAMHFDHRLFDAEGAEAFLDLFQRWYSGEDCRARLAGIALTEPAHLSDWKQKFEAGKQLVRLLLVFSKTTLAVLPRPMALKGRGFKFSIMEFDEATTRAITERAHKQAGFLMFMPYALATAIEALHKAFESHEVHGKHYIVSVSVGQRTPETAASHLFFNHLSFLFFRISAESAGDRTRVLAEVRSQMYEQVKSGFPRALGEASMLMRIMPPCVLSRLLLSPLRGEFASLGFSCIGKGGYTFSKFMEAGVENLFHTPLVPVPPGVGFVVNRFGNRMNAVLSYVDGMLSDEDARRIQDDVRRML